MTGANAHDSTQVDAVILGKIDEPRLGSKENLCADAGYVGKEIAQRMMEYGYMPHVKSRSKEVAEKKTQDSKPKRWVVEACHSWMNNFRKLRVRYEKTHSSYIGLCKLACAIITLNKIGIVYG